MSDRRNVYDTTKLAAGGAIKGGLSVARMDTAKVEAGFSRSGNYVHPASRAPGGDRVGVPTVKVSKTGRVTVVQGAGAFAAGRDAGLTTVPVAMSATSARNAHKAKMLAPGGYASNSNSRRTSSSVGFSIVIDLTDMRRLGDQLNAAAVVIKRGDATVSRAINRSIRMLSTKIKRKAKAWTGLRTIGEVTKGFMPKFSTPATKVGVLSIRDNQRTVARANFGATWSRRDPGGRHHAWGGHTLAVGSFFAGNHQPLFKRTGVRVKMTKGKYKDEIRERIAPLWGSNVVREIQRHYPEVQADVNLAAADVQREAVRLMRVAIQKAAAK